MQRWYCWQEFEGNSSNRWQDHWNHGFSASSDLSYCICFRHTGCFSEQYLAASCWSRSSWRAWIKLVADRALWKLYHGWIDGQTDWRKGWMDKLHPEGYKAAFLPKQTCSRAISAACVIAATFDCQIQPRRNPSTKQRIAIAKCYWVQYNV